MKKLSADQLLCVSGGATDSVVIDLDTPSVHTEDRSWTSYLPSLRDTLVFVGGAVAGGLALWAIGHTFFKDAAPASN